MDPKEKQQYITTLLQTPEWVSVVEVVRDQICDLLDIRNIDTTQSDDLIARELRARYLAVEQLIKFYNKYQFSSDSKDDIEMSFR